MGEHRALGEEVGGFAYRADHVVGQCLIPGGEVVDLVMGLVERRADQLGHAGIEDGEAGLAPLLDVEHPADQAAALPHQRPPQLEVHLLPGGELQIFGKCVEISGKIRHRPGVGMLVVDSQTSTEIEQGQGDLPLAEPALDLVHPPGEALEDGDVGDLRADMKVDSLQLEVGELLHLRHHFSQLGIVNAELVLLPPGGDVLVGVGINIGIDAQGDRGGSARLPGQAVDHLELLQ